MSMVAASALLRQGTSGRQPILSWGELKLDPSTFTVTYASELVSLTPGYQLLELFLRNGQRSQAALLDRLWSFEDIPNGKSSEPH